MSSRNPSICQEIKHESIFYIIRTSLSIWFNFRNNTISFHVTEHITELKIKCLIPIGVLGALTINV